MAAACQAPQSAPPEAQLSAPPQTKAQGKVSFALIAAGTPPDVFESGAVFVPTLALRKAAVPLDGYAARDKFDLKDFWPGILNGTSWRGQTFALTDTWAVNNIYYNRDAYRGAGVPVPTKDWTFDQWVESSLKLTNEQADPPRWGLFYSTVFFAVMPIMWAFGADWWDESRTKVTLNSPEALAAIEWIANTWNKHRVSPPPAVTSQRGQGYRDLFHAGRLASYHYGGHWEATAHQEAKVDWAATTLPKGPKGHAGYAFMAIYGVSSSSKNVDGGWEWLKFMTGEDGYMAKGGDLQATPARQSLRDKHRGRELPWWVERGGFQSQLDLMPFTRNPRYVPEFAAIRDEFIAALGMVWSGQASP
jgi:multiple sugar transport system substrate-binding protein